MDINESANPTNIPKNHTLKFRYDDEIEEKLRYLSEKNFVSKSEIVRKGIEIQYNEENEWFSVDFLCVTIYNKCVTKKERKWQHVSSKRKTSVKRSEEKRY